MKLIIRPILFARCIAGFLAMLPIIGHGQATLANGYTYQSAIVVTGEIDSWTFTASNRDAIIIRIGRISQTSSSQFDSRIILFSPIGLQLGWNSDHDDAEINITATNSGKFTVYVDDGHTGNGTGAYRLTLAKSPGDILVSPGDEGGLLTNGWKHSGFIDVGDLDVWKFSANTGDNIIVRMGGTNAISDQIKIFGPDGMLQAVNAGAADGRVFFRATNSGTFNVVADSFFAGESGSYNLSLAKMPGAYLTSPGDEGGLMTPQVSYDGTNDLGDQDMWSFFAFTGVGISLEIQKLGGNSYSPKIEVYGPDGNLVTSTVDNILSYTPTNTGLFTAIVGSALVRRAGTYRLTGTNISGGLKFITSGIIGSNFVCSVTGGASNLLCYLQGTTNLALPSALWTSLKTNSCDSAGLTIFTNSQDIVRHSQFFRLLAP